MKFTPIKATFIDEISHDIPHQNWGPKEWAADFDNMHKMGINTVVVIRCGYRKWLTYPSDFLTQNLGCYRPPIDLIKLFLDLASERNMDFYFGLYDSGQYWYDSGDYQREINVNKYVIDEVWAKYGHHSAFKGWYITHEVSRKSEGIIDLYGRLGHHCKDISNGLQTMISPYIDGRKAVLAKDSTLTKPESVSLQQHEKDWDEILSQTAGAVDVIAFQDGHVTYEELPDFFRINKALTDTYNITSWTNCESFDRDMPIKFLPIKWEKMLLKLQAAKAAGIDQAITFEFSHFMSPQSAYLQAGHLYNRYLDQLNAEI